MLLAVLGLLLFDLLRAAHMPVLPAAAVSTLVLLSTAAGIGHAFDEAMLASGLTPMLQLLSLASVLVLGWWLASAASTLRSRGVKHMPESIPHRKPDNRRERMVATLHKRLLHEVARHRAKGRHSIPTSIRELLVAGRDNLSAFDRNLEVTEAACRGGDAKLLLSALDRLIAIEEQAVAIMQVLVEALRQLQKPTSRR